MTSRQTILYIGAIDEHYLKLCHQAQEEGYTTMQLKQMNAILNLVYILDVFIIILNQDALTPDDAETVIALKQYCKRSKITIVEIEADVVSVQHSHWY